MKYWIVTYDQKDFEISLQRGFDLIGLPSEDRWKRMLQRVSKGDRIIAYASGISRFGVILEATSEVYEEHSKIWASNEEMWPFRIKTNPLLILPEDIHVDPIAIIQAMDTPSEKQKVRTNWALFLRGSMREISEHDYNLITEEMSRAMNKPAEPFIVKETENEEIEPPKFVDPTGNRFSTESRDALEKEIPDSKLEELFYRVDNKKREKALKVHQFLVNAVISRYKGKARIEMKDNNHVDLAVYNSVKNTILLFEMKSASSKLKARVQARRAVSQLLEYEFFDISQFFPITEGTKIFKILVMDVLPPQTYVDYLETLEIYSLQVLDDQLILSDKIKEILDI